MKQCNTCKRVLPRWKFHSNFKHSDGLQGHCVDCCNEKHRKFRKQHPDHTRECNANMYPGEWQIKLKKQNYECAFPSCHCKENLVGDHNHRTGKFRAILCNSHNLLLGHADDDPKVLQEGIEYLEKHNVRS